MHNHLCKPLDSVISDKKVTAWHLNPKVNSSALGNILLKCG